MEGGGRKRKKKKISTNDGCELFSVLRNVVSETLTCVIVNKVTVQKKTKIQTEGRREMSPALNGHALDLKYDEGGTLARMKRD